MVQTHTTRLTHQGKLGPGEKAILRDLLRVGATTPNKFEVGTNRIGVNVNQELDSLYYRGLIGKRANSEVFYPTIKTWVKTYFS